MKNQRLAYVYAFLAIICWSTIGSAFKLTLRYIEFRLLLTIASFTAVTGLFAIVFLQRKVHELRKLKRSDFYSSAFLGFLNPYLYYLVLLKAYDLLPAQEAGTLNYIWPLALVLLSIPLLGQKIRPLSLVAILISFAGIIMISTHGNILGLKFSSPAGVLLALGSALFWSLYWIYNLKDKREEVTKLFLNFSFGFLYIFITVCLGPHFRVTSWQGLAGSVYLGFFEMAFPFVFWLMALKFSQTTAKVSNLIYLSPFISLILIHFVIGEQIFMSTVFGLVLIISGILLQQKLR